MPDELPPIEWIIESFGYGVLLPCAVTTVLLLFSLLVGKGRPSARFAGALAFAGGLFAGYVALGYVQDGWEPFRPKDSWHWIPYVAVLAVLVDLIDLPFATRPKLGADIRIVSALIVIGMLADRLVPTFEKVLPDRPIWLVVLSVAVFGLWLMLPPVADRRKGGLPPFLVSFVFLAAGAVLEASGNLKFAQVAGVLAGVFGGCAIVSWWRPEGYFFRGMVPGVAVGLPALLLNCCLSSAESFPRASFLLVAFAPLGLWVGAIPAVARLRTIPRVLVEALALLVPLGIAVGLAATTGE